MQTQFQYIINLAKKYKTYAESPKALYDALNELPQEIIEDVYSEYGDPEKSFKPTNLLRAEVARRLLKNEKVNDGTVEEIKDKIRNKEISYFSHLSKSLVEELEEYTMGKRDIFANWQKPWSVFHPFFYRQKVSKEKENVQNYLEQIAKDLLLELKLNDYTFHSVDFQGANNFGSDTCWIALYPEIKNSHKDSYQFFVRFGAESVAGMAAGHSIRNAKPNQFKKVDSYDTALKYLENIKESIIQLNQEIRNYFKFSPGSQASEWERLYNENIAAIRFQEFDLGDITKYNSREEINKAVGFSEDSWSNLTWNLWLFKSANVGDVIFANKGVNTCIGIGIIEGDYYYKETPDGYNHKRKVKWITNKVYHYKPDTLRYNATSFYKTLFRPDTFSPTLVREFLLSEYVRMYPELKSIFDQNNLQYTIDAEDKITTSSSELDNDPQDEKESINFWWLNANPKIWSISNFKEGEKQTYTTHNEKGNKRRIYKYFEEAKAGDLVIGYESSPTKQVMAIYEVTKGLHNTIEGEVIEFVLIEKLETPVNWNDLKNIPSLQMCEVFTNNQGSLFRLTEEEFDIIREVIDNKNIEIVHDSPNIKYKFSEDTDKPFVQETDFLQAVAILKRKKNIILQGPPGVGKTFIARKLAYEIMQEVKDTNIEMVQFHQSYSYEDFIQGLKPTQRGSFDIKDGVFYSFCQRALAHPDKPFFFIIDEINRGNLSKIFGELMMLIEPDKRSKSFALKLTYAIDEDDRFYVPENLYIIGTMNTADRSLAIVDYALRRRFAFVTMHPDFGNSFRTFLLSNGASVQLVEHICSSVTKVNEIIKNDPNLGEGMLIGHSYFCTYKNEKDEDIWWSEILNFELKPLMEEIWFDDSAKVSDMLKILSR